MSAEHMAAKNMNVQQLRYVLRLCGISLVLALVACGGLEPRDGPGRIAKATKAPPVVPKKEPLSKYGNPESYVVFGKRYYPLKTNVGFREQGVASWYGKKFHGRKTSSGEIYDMYKMTAAHKHLPLPSYVTVRNTKTDQSVVVRVNDRGPFHDNRVIDLSYAAASKLGIVNSGTGFVEVTAMNAGSNQSRITNSTFDKPVVNKKSEIIIDPGQQRTAESKNGSKAPNYVAEQDPSHSPNSAPSDAPENIKPPSTVYLQIGAFRERGNAQIALNRVIGHIPAARIQETQSAGIPVYRVQIGPISNVHNADEYVERLFALGFADHHFISP